MKCKVEGCESSWHRQALCVRHYMQYRRGGIGKGSRPQGSLHERLWAKIDKRGPDECWEWQAKEQVSGYGKLSRGGRGSGAILAHRAVWEEIHGPIPQDGSWHGRVILHTCDNRLCCNPAHLRIGTQGENVKDMDAKKRRVNAPRQGEKHHKAKLTDDQVRFIRTSKESNRALGRQFGVSHAMIGYIKRGANWRHIA